MRRICTYCRRPGWVSKDEGVTTTGAVRPKPCACGESHRICNECWGRLARVIGEFPHQAHALTACPDRQMTKG